jgi:hypothetical protein
MNKPAVLASLTLVAALTATAHADDTQTVTAGTLVVVTPNAPVVVTTGAGPGAQAAQATRDNSDVPQNEDWRNVSHINGQLVPVGERGAYLWTQKKTNLAANPFGLLFGYYDASASFALSNNVAISGSITGYSLDSAQGYAAAVSLPIYFRRTFSGPFLEPGLVTRSSTISCGDCYERDSWAGPEVLFGWHWSFDSGLNVVTAFGAARRLATSQSYQAGRAEPVGYFRVGYEF